MKTKKAKQQPATGVRSSDWLGVTSFDILDNMHTTLVEDIASSVLDNPSKQRNPSFYSLLSLRFGNFVIRVNKHSSESLAVRGPDDVSAIRRVIKFVAACYMEMRQKIGHLFVIVRRWGVHIHNVRSGLTTQAERCARKETVERTENEQ